jgi:hypothetical protein
MAASAREPPIISAWYYVIGTAAVVVYAYLFWRVRTGWQLHGKYYRRGNTEIGIAGGYVALPGLIMFVPALIFPVLMSLPVWPNRTASKGVALFCVVVIFVSLAVMIKEGWRPSRWNKPPPWLAEAIARGEIKESEIERGRRRRRSLALSRGGYYE